MRKFTIILDCDDVMADTTTYLLKRAKEEYGVDIKKEQVTNWHLEDVFPDIDLVKFFSEEGFFLNLEPQEGAVHYCKTLIEAGHEIIVTTASPRSGFKDKSLWLEKHFPFIPERNLILAWRKECVYGDIMLDDAPHNIESSICDLPVVFAQPWNKDIKADCVRVNSWFEFYKLVHDMSKM